VPALALFLCTVFVLVLLKIERRQAPDVSAVLWLPTSWMLLIASKPFGTWFGVGGEDGSLLDEVFLSALLCVGVLILLNSRRFRLSRVIEDNGWLLLLLIYSLISLLWSDIPFISLKRWIREVIAVVMALLVLTERNPRAALQSLFRRTVFVLIPFSLLLIKYFPAYGVQYRNQGGLMWIGVALQKNSLARLCIIAALFLIWMLVRRWKGIEVPAGKLQTLADISVLGLALFILSGPEDQYSATAVTSLTAGLAVFLGLQWMRRHHVRLGANVLTISVAIILSVGVLQPFLNGATVAAMSSVVGRDATLTGRTEIWAGLVPEVMQEPVLGSGFGSFWTPDKRLVHQIGEAHNGYLEVLLDRGWVGVVLVSMFVLSSCRKAQRLLPHDYDWGALSISFLIVALVHNVTESSINSFGSPLTAVLLFFSITSTTYRVGRVQQASRNALERASRTLR
jgi:exopolysaccharide production protein ExoQ